MYNEQKLHTPQTNSHIPLFVLIWCSTPLPSTFYSTISISKRI